MALAFSHAVGYHGIAAFGKGTLSDDTFTITPNSFKMLLATGGQVNINYDPIDSAGVWGANAAHAMKIAYAKNYPRLEGNVSFELTNVYPSPGLGTDGNDAVLLYPDGSHGFKGRAWGNTFSVECNEGSAMASSQGFIGDPSGDNLSAGVASDSFWKTNSDVNQSAPDFTGATLIPYYCGYVSIDNGSNSSSSTFEVISWTYNSNRDLQLLKLCDGSGPTAPSAADYIVQGEKTVDGNLTVFQIRSQFKDNFSASPTFGYKYSEGGTTKTIEYRVPNAYFTSKSTSLTTGSSYIQCDFSFNGYGDMGHDKSNSNG